MKEVIIRAFKPGDEVEVCRLVRTVFDGFVAPDYSSEGNETFYDWIKPENILSRQMVSRFLFTATVDASMVGVIEVRDNNHVSLLFVDKDHQQQGIAGRLLSVAIAESRKRDSKLETYEVYSSPFAIPIYEKMGFVSMDECQEKSGIIYQPMILKL